VFGEEARSARTERASILRSRNRVFKLFTVLAGRVANEAVTRTVFATKLAEFTFGMSPSL
jgi:hypothetical protein